MSQEYNAGLLIEGWCPIRIVAQNRNEVQRLIASGVLSLQLVNSKTHEPIGEIVADFGEPMMKVEIEDIEVHRPDEVSSYHAPARREPVDLA